MVISKDWLQEQIDNEVDAAAKTAYQRCYTELTKPPTPKSGPTKKEINIEKGYDAIVKYYMNNEFFCMKWHDIEVRKQKANEIAMMRMDQQQQRISENS